MKKTILSLAIAISILSGCSTKVIFTTSEKDAKIYVDGRFMGTGETPVVKVKKHTCVNVKTEKTGFLTNDTKYCYTGYSWGRIKTKTIDLTHDDAFDASIKNDYANKDFEQEIDSRLSESDAWKIISQIVTSYFDNLEMADKATGYMKTSWQSKSFSQKTIRTRVIVKQSSISPLKYKLKIISEYCDQPNQSVKDDDKFKEWDRILKAYDELINEFQARLGQK